MTTVLIQIGSWWAGMAINYAIDGSILIGGVIGTIVGLIIVLI